MKQREPVCEFCGAYVPMEQLLWHEAYHDQVKLMFENFEGFMTSTVEGFALLHALIDSLEAQVDEATR